MQIGIEEPVAPRKRTRTIYAVVAVILVVMTSVYYLYQYKFSRLVRVHDAPNSEREAIWDDTAKHLAMYIFLDSASKPNPDLRTKWWEDDLKSFDWNISVHYLADKQIPSLGRDLMIPSVCQNDKDDCDSTYCYRNIESWTHFVKHEGKKKWYFKGFQDTYVNVDHLMDELSHVEKNIDPMKVPYFMYAVDEYNGVAVPDGITGWIISNAAVKTLFHHAQHFTYACDKQGEDAAMASMIQNMQLEVHEFISPFFIAKWPANTEEFLTSVIEDVDECPSHQYRTAEKVKAPLEQVHSLVATRMENVPMDKVPVLLKDTSVRLRIGYKHENEPVFCKVD